MNDLNHLTDEELSALLDDALPANERAECDAHLAGCEACRARLAEYSALDASVERALTHDPGEAYFASFAERVSARIAAESGAGIARAADGAGAAAKRSPWAWLLSPRGLTLAGSTAALVLAAGLAWMRFGTHPDAAFRMQGSSRTSRVLGADDRAAPQTQATPPAASMPSADGAPEGHSNARAPEISRLDQPQGPLVTPPAESAPAKQPAPVGASRAREVKSAEEEAKTRALAAPPTAGSRLDQREKQEPARSLAAEMKRRSLRPAQEKVATRDELQKSSAKAAAPTASAPLPTAAPFAERAQANVMSSEGVSVESPCGTVLDARGQPLAGAQVAALGAETRTARTGADGRFCLPSLAAGDTLSVLHIGYEPLRIVVGSAASLAIRLEPVATLARQSGALGISSKDQPSITEGDDASKLSFTRRAPFAHAADVYATEPTAIRLAVAEARRTTEQARRERTAKSYEQAAERWERIGTLAKGRAELDARFQGLGALREAYRLEPTPARATRLRARLITFLEMAPDSLPERDTALRWQAEFEAHH